MTFKKSFFFISLVYILTSCDAIFAIEESNYTSSSQIVADSNISSQSKEEEPTSSINKSEESSLPNNSNYQMCCKANLYKEAIAHTSNYETYCFYTDPHFYIPDQGYDFDEERITEGFSFLEKAIEMFGADFIVCGGDVLCSGETKSQACYKLSNYVRLSNKYFDSHYFIVGNHDTNYQGKSFIENGDYHDCILSQETINSVLFDGRKSYYRFDSLYTGYYCFDSGLDWTAREISEYQEEQLSWFADSLMSETKPHVVLFVHMAVINDYNELSAMIKTLRQIMKAFNDKETVTFKGRLFDYSSTIGRIELVQTGHIHKDSLLYCNNIPIVSTDAFFDKGSESQPTFDVVLLDYSNEQIHLFRIGNGEDRVVAMQQNDD